MKVANPIPWGYSNWYRRNFEFLRITRKYIPELTTAEERKRRTEFAPAVIRQRFLLLMTEKIGAKRQEIRTHQELCEFCSKSMWYAKRHHKGCVEILVLQNELHYLKEDLKHAYSEKVR